MYISAGKVNGLFHIEAVNHKLNQNTGGREEEGVSLRSDIAMISQNGKAMSAIERLMRQKDFIRECKDSLIEQMLDKESENWRNRKTDRRRSKKKIYIKGIGR